MSDGAEERLAAGDPHGALAALQGRVRERPADSAARVFLFQLLCVLGEWGRAGRQLDVAAELDPGTLLMAQTCRELLRCETLREAVFAGRRAPMVLGEPPEWLAPLVRALPLAAKGDGAGAAALATEAFERARASAGRLGPAGPDADATGDDGSPGEGAPKGAGAGDDATLDVKGTPDGEGASGGEAFDWIGDADMRLGPVLEAMIDGKYYWVPFERLAALKLEAPGDLRDLVWTPAELTWRGEGTSVGFVPTRYPLAAREADGGAAGTPDPACLMSRRTEWTDLGGDYFVGRGQRVLASSAGEHSLLECRVLRFDPAATG